LLVDGLRVHRPGVAGTYAFTSFAAPDTAYFGSVYSGGYLGQIQFRVSDGTNNIDALRINASGNVGIGTTAPGYPLTVANNPGAGGVVSRISHTGNAGSPGTALQVSNGYAAAGGNYEIFGVYGNNFGAKYLSVTDNGNVGIGTASPVHPLQVAGAIGAEEIIVSSNGADYVFDPDYRLAPLNEVADYIKANHHLPEIPSAQEVQEKGVSLGDMQAKLLAKIEELTLHMIQAEKENRDLRDRIARLEAWGTIGSASDNRGTR